MFGRLLLTAFALWWGYNATQMFSCDSVTWSRGRPTCMANVVPWQDVSWLESGAGQSTLILIAVVLILGWLWVWPFVRREQRRTDVAQSRPSEREQKSVSPADSDVKSTFRQATLRRKCSDLLNEIADAPSSKELAGTLGENVAALENELRSSNDPEIGAFRVRWVAAAEKRAAELVAGGDQKTFREALVSKGLEVEGPFFDFDTYASTKHPNAMSSLITRTMLMGDFEADDRTDASQEASEGSPEGRLTEIEDLHSRGVITDAEYERKRRSIIDEL